jgi:Zn-dependent M28 family amino/carboxypeptidase
MGRRTGTPGEILAMLYISEQFKIIGLQPKGTAGYVQSFSIDEGKIIDPTTFLSIDRKPLQLNTEFIPLAFSATKPIKGSSAIGLREANQPWYFDLKEVLEANTTNPHFDVEAEVKKEAAKLAARGATALLVYNTTSLADNLAYNLKDKSAAATIPVIYVTQAGYKKYLSDPFATLDIAMKVGFTSKKKSGNNVVGYIDNSSPQTIVIGAHYDHLGLGEDANALDTIKGIHNGADDNASGTAAMIELARMLSINKSKTHNFLFVAFSGEELGLIGSKYWLDNPTVTVNTNYMINLDMVGRYDATKALTIGGYGTSPEWSNIFTAVNDKSLKIKFDSTGGGPSDHASFYRKNIPVLFFFTGSHADYHKVSDDWDKINYDGQFQIVKLISRIIAATENKGKLAFAKTTEPQMGTTKLPVTLGVIPDYSYSGTGLRIDGVSPQKTAEKIGLKAGDVLMKLGDHDITDINAYMKALGYFKKGDRTSLRIVRVKEQKDFEVEF